MRDLDFGFAEETSAPVAGISPVQHGDASVKSELVLPPTLETRKKKNKKSELTRLTNPSLETESPLAQLSPSEESGQLLKFGPKRKFSPDDDGLLSDQDQEDDEFQFSRSIRHTEKQTLPFQLDKQSSTPSKAPMEMQQSPAKLEPAKRKVLKPSMDHDPLIIIGFLTSLTYNITQKAQIQTSARPERCRRH